MPRSIGGTLPCSFGSFPPVFSTSPMAQVSAPPREAFPSRCPFVVGVAIGATLAPIAVDGPLARPVETAVVLGGVA